MASTEAAPTTTAAASSSAAAVTTTTTTTPKLKNLTQAVTNMIEFQAFLLTDSSALHVAYFWAEWDEPSKAGGAMDTLVSKLAELHPAVRFARIEAEVAEEVSQQFEVSMAPTFIFFKSKTQVDKVEGADAPAVTKRVEKWEKASASASSSSSSSSQVVQSLLDLEIELDRLVTASPVMLFMKGTPSEPKCKFSRQIVEILRAENTAFGSFDILSNEAVRQGLKEKFNWPTFPQLYIDAKLVGGVDIVKELQEAGELSAMLPKPPANAVGASGAGGANTNGGIRARVEHVISSSPVLLFMKGTVTDPACGFSERACDVLKEGEIDFKTFDVLADPAMREAVKEYSDFPTYPQLFVYGKLVGGIEALKDLQAKSQTQQQNSTNQKTLSDLLGELYGDGKSIPTKEPLNDRLKRLTHKSPAVLFMKGSADEPRCGFSARAVETLRRCGLDVSSSSSTFSTFDILSDAEVREGLKIYSNWPTFPQLYIEGKLIGGLDILKELEDEGELSAMLGALKSA